MARYEETENMIITINSRICNNLHRFAAQHCTQVRRNGHIIFEYQIRQNQGKAFLMVVYNRNYCM